MSWLDDYLEALARRPLPDMARLRADAAKAPRPRAFREALAASSPVGVIAEVKFKSPSMGVLRPAFDVEVVAAQYAAAGAACLSVLVDAPHFGGDPAFLKRARTACGLPLLAKGFFVDERDVLSMRAAGADAILLIARCLSRERLAQLHTLALDAGMAALVELHSESDLEKIHGLGVALVGVNHRDLDHLTLDLSLSRRMAPRLPAQALWVAESGLETASDLLEVARLGFRAVLVGTGFMRHPEPGAALGQFLSGITG